jgi:hypothetical protein
MSQDERGAAGQGGDGKAGGPKRLKIVVDGRQLESTEPRLTGLQIKTLAGVDTSFGLFLEGRGQGSDRPIGDGEIVDLEQHGKESFYTAPPANYGSGARPGRGA